MNRPLIWLHLSNIVWNLLLECILDECTLDVNCGCNGCVYQKSTFICMARIASHRIKIHMLLYHTTTHQQKRNKDRKINEQAVMMIHNDESYERDTHRLLLLLFFHVINAHWRNNKKIFYIRNSRW